MKILAPSSICVGVLFAPFLRIVTSGHPPETLPRAFHDVTQLSFVPCAGKNVKKLRLQMTHLKQYCTDLEVAKRVVADYNASQTW